MTFTEWFFAWPCLVLYILAVCAARIAVDHSERKQNRRRQP